MSKQPSCLGPHELMPTPEIRDGHQGQSDYRDKQCGVTLCLLCHSLAEELVAGLYQVSQPTISRIKNRIEPILDQVLTFSGIGLKQASTE